MKKQQRKDLKKRKGIYIFSHISDIEGMKVFTVQI